ncbi:MAG: transposase [Terriglobia bacterium]
MDETGATPTMTRTYGRAPRGQRVQGSVPGHWESVTLISGVWLSGVVAPVAFPGATDTPAFAGYVEQTLAPQLRPGDVMIWDKHDLGQTQGAPGRRGASCGRGRPGRA